MIFWPFDPFPGSIFLAVACPIHVSNSHTKFGWISSNGLGGDNGWPDGQAEYPLPFFACQNRSQSRQFCRIYIPRQGLLQRNL